MQGPKIYSDFYSEVVWIRKEIARDVHSLPSSVQPQARFYTQERLKILKQSSDSAVLNGSGGTPIIYFASWFADALGLNDGRLRRLAGYSLICSYIAGTVRDDLFDSGPANDPEKRKLLKFWTRRYLESLRDVFPTERGFNRVTSLAEADWRRYQEWQSAPSREKHSRPFSADFLGESSRYYVACILPTLVAIAHAAGREREAPRIERFTRAFSMGCRIVDDLADWEPDLAAFQLNRSSVLIYVKNTMEHPGTLDRNDVLSCFMGGELLKDAYDAMIGFFQRARRSVAIFENQYLDRFMEDLIGSQSEERDSQLRHAALALSVLDQGLREALGSATRV